MSDVSSRHAYMHTCIHRYIGRRPDVGEAYSKFGVAMHKEQNCGRQDPTSSNSAASSASRHGGRHGAGDALLTSVMWLL